jgi:hypothetical protein
MREDGFPEIWMPSSEQRDLRTLLRDRHQWVKIRTRVQNTLQAIALNHALHRSTTSPNYRVTPSPLSCVPARRGWTIALRL